MPTDKALKDALKELCDHTGLPASAFPTYDTVSQAKAGAKWSGKKSVGSKKIAWEMVKNRAGSYTNHTDVWE